MSAPPAGATLTPMSEDEAIGSRELFVDERGAALRATWHPEAGVVVLSLWREGQCLGTFRLGTADAARLSTLLTHAWVENLRLSLESS